jgi:hypothetical protein
MIDYKYAHHHVKLPRLKSYNVAADLSRSGRQMIEPARFLFSDEL